MTLLEKLSKIQSELKVSKDRQGRGLNYTFRSCEDIQEKAKPICEKYKAVVLITESVELIGDRYYIQATSILCDLESADKLTVTAYSREPEQLPTMDQAKTSGAASSYAKKRSLSNLFQLDNSDDDPDNYGGENGVGSAQRLTDERKTESRPTEPQSKKIAPRAPQTATEGKAIATADEMAQIKAKISAAKARTGLSQKDIFSKVIAAKFAYDKSASAFYSADFQKVCDFIDGLQGEEAEPLPWNE